MKITNISPLRIYLNDLQVVHGSQSDGRIGENRYLEPGAFTYVPNTGEVIRSAYKGDLRKWAQNGVVTLEDTVTLDASGGTNDVVGLAHGFRLPPIVYVLKQVGSAWVDAAGTYDVIHDPEFTAVTLSNTLNVPQTLFIRLM